MGGYDVTTTIMV